MDNKDKVYECYEKIVSWYDQHRSRDLFEKSYLDIAISYLPKGAKILDLGCGMGEPIGRYFIEHGFQVTGVDASEKMLALARSRLEACRFILADMRGLDLNEKFDCVIAWHSFFHLSQEEQRKMFLTFSQHINENGILLFTSGPDAGEVWSDNGGENLYHASLSPEEYKKLLEKHHFELIIHKTEDAECRGATVWLARFINKYAETNNARALHVSYNR